MRADQILPDDASHAEFEGIQVRKGTVAAFIQNAKSWSDPSSDDVTREAAGNEIQNALPALHALGLFDVLEVRDARLRAFLKFRDR